MRDPKKSSRSELPVSRRTLLRGAAGGAAAAALPPALVAGPKGARAEASSSAKDFSVTSGDAYVNYQAQPTKWTFGTSFVEKEVDLTSGGAFYMSRLLNKTSGTEYVQGSSASDEFNVVVNGQTYSGTSGGWSLVSYEVSPPDALGRLELTIILTQDGLQVTRRYTVHPATGVFRESSAIQGPSASQWTLASPSTIRLDVMRQDLSTLNMHYLTGGGNFTGSGVLKTIDLSSSYSRTFDSEDAVEIQKVDGQFYSFASYPFIGGTEVYDTFFVLRNTAGSGEGIWLTFDYNGHWFMDATNASGDMSLDGWVGMGGVYGAGPADPGVQMAAGASIDLPTTTLGVFVGDLDEMGNTVAGYTYTYLWDYTRLDGVILGGVQFRISPQFPSAWESANYTRYIGADTVHIDDHWFDNKGDWNPAIPTDDFAGLNQYIGKSGIHMKVWSPFWMADYASQVVQEHPDWVCSGDSLGYYGLHLNLSNPDVAQWILDTASSKQSEWGAYQWRNDADPTWLVNGNWQPPATGTDADMLAMSNAYFALLKKFKDQNPDAMIENVSSGGETMFMESVRFSETQQLTDGGALHYGGYYQSLKLPFDKLGHAFYSAPEPGVDTSFNDPTPPDATTRETTRRWVDLQRYLRAQGLFGRWVRIYRPATAGQVDPTYIIQKTTWDQTKGIITFSSYTPYWGSNLVIYPKGLLDGTDYTVTSLNGSVGSQKSTGANLMANGISVSGLTSGETIFFNIVDYPGSTTYTSQPGPPKNVTKKRAGYLGYNGIELNWGPGHDTKWISYYEVELNGVPVDKVSVGTFDFIPNAQVTDDLRVRTVNGGGLASMYTPASEVAGSPVIVTPPPPPSSFQASTDFGSVEGGQYWAYLQQDTRNPFPTQFYVQNMMWNAADGYWTGDEQYVIVGPGWMATSDNNNSVRQWIAPRAGTVRVTATISTGQPDQGGDGVDLSIQQSTSAAWTTQTVWGPVTLLNNGGPVSHDITVSVKAYSALYFVVNKRQTTNFDNTEWDPNITYSD